MKKVKPNNLGGRILSALLTVALVGGLMPNNMLTVKAEESTSTPLSVTAFATSEQLMSSDNFALHTDTGSGTAQKVYFGMNGKSQQTWYIAGGEDHDGDGTKDSIVLLCDPSLPMATDTMFENDWQNNKTYSADWRCTYETAPSDVYPNHYGASDLRGVLQKYTSNDNTEKFSAAEKELMQSTKVYTDDDKQKDDGGTDCTYYTEDVLYPAYGDYIDNKFITVGANSAGSLNGGLKVSLISAPYNGGYRFWLRAPFYIHSNDALVADPGDFVDYNDVRFDYLVVPAFRLNLSSVLFASAAKAATSDASLTDTMTFRVEGDDKITSKAYYSTDNVIVDVAEDETVYLYVQGNDGTNDWVYSQEISADGTIATDTLKSGAKDSNGSAVSPTSVDLSQCKIWIEKKVTDDNLVYAVMAKEIDITKTNVTTETLTYTGEALTPTFTITFGNTTLTVDDYDVIVTAQTNAGDNYKATIKGKGNCTGTVENVAWSIGKATPTADIFTYTAPTNLDFDSAEKTAMVGVKDNITGMGEITVKYYKNGEEEGTTTPPTDAGTYSVKISVAEGTNFYATDGELEMGSFTIAKATPTADIFTYTAPTNLDFDGAQKTAMVGVKDNITGMGEITVKYYKNGEEEGTTTPPTDAGTYSVKISVAEGTNFYATDGELEMGSFTIAKATPTADIFTYTAPTNLDFDGAQKTAMVGVKDNITGMGEITVKYYKNGGEKGTTTPPTDAGTYSVKISVAEGTNFYATDSELEMGSFTIAKATPYIVTPPTAADITFGQSVSDSTLTGGAAQHSESKNTTVAGIFSWKDKNKTPTVADSNNTGYDVIFTPDDKDNYETVSTKVKLTVKPSDTTPNMPESTMSALYSQKTVGAVELPEGWGWNDVDSTKELTVGKAVEATAIYNGADKGNYNTESVTISITREDCTHTGETEVKDAKEATCGEEGYTGDTYCKDCGKQTATGKVIEKEAHTYGEPTFSWSEDGKTCTVVFTCKEDTEHIARQEAKVTSEVKTAATCKAKGTTTYTATYSDTDKVYSTEGKTYTDAKDVEDIPVDKTKHEESNILYTGEGEKAPTCTVDGIGHTECTKCKEPIQTNVTVEASGHTGGTATCKNKAECSTCHEGYGELDQDNHTGETEVRDAKKATCAADGYTGDTYCKDCGAKIATGTKIDKSTAHTWDNGIVTKEATATEKGEKTYTCSVCKTTKKEEIPALGAPKVGEEIASEDRSATYKVTEAGENGNSVTYEAPTDKNQATVVVPATVTINNITYNVTTISDTAFAGNKKLTSVTIGDNVTGFSDKTFKGCTNLKILDVGNGVTSIPANAFKNFKNLTTVKMGTGVKTIGKNAFYGCKKLKNLTLGKNVVTIGDKAFYKCTSLTKVTIPSKVKTIGKSTFEGCKALKTITIGKSVTKIGSKAFYGCSKTKTLTIKSSKLTTKKIGSKAFTKTPKSMTVKVPKKKFKAYKSMFIKRGVNKKAKFRKS